jgi:iron-sulfur cluster assembly protein
MATTNIEKPTKRALPPLMQLSDAAAERLRKLYANTQQGAKLLRVSVSTKGCSGMSYDLGWVDEAGPGDEVVTDKDVTLVVDRKATLFLIGTTMDYEVKPMSAGFTFINPNEKGRCGCGESFHV